MAYYAPLSSLAKHDLELLLVAHMVAKVHHGRLGRRLGMYD